MNNYCMLYIVRHGQTDWNVSGTVQGHTDVELNAKGIEQAKKRAGSLKHIKFDKVYSSDLLRAKKTAEILTLEHNLAIETSKLLRERAFGKHEGKHYAEVNKLFTEFQKLTDEQKYTFRGDDDIETDEEVVIRFIQFIREVAIAQTGKNVLIVTHGGVIRQFLIRIGYATYETLNESLIKNTAMIVVESDGVDFFVKEVDGVERKDKR